MPPKAANSKNPERALSITKHTVPEGKPVRKSIQQRDSKNKIKISKPFDEKPNLNATKNLTVKGRKSTATTSKTDIVVPSNSNILKEIEAISSASSSETEESNFYEEEEATSEFTEPHRKFLQLLSQPSKFLFFDISSEDESSVEEEPEYLLQNALVEEEDFFETFGEVPAVDELSEDVTEDLIIQEQVRKKTLSTTGDAGKFVNPLTGESFSTLSSRRSTEVVVVVEEKKTTDKSDEVVESSRSGESDLSDELIPAEDKTDHLDDVMEDNTLAHKEVDEFMQFLELEREREAAAAHVDVDLAMEKLIREQQERLNYEQTMEFLNNLIDSCVDKAEYVDDNIIMRKNLDKSKLILELKSKLEILDSEKKTMQFLNRKCSEYFRRKGSFRQLTDDNTSTNNTNYYKILRHLDKVLIREEELKKELDLRLEECREQYEIIEGKSQQEVQQLENLMRSTFHREKFDKLKESVSHQLGEMSSLRKEISTVRFQLFVQQHDVSHLEKEMQELEDLGNGLRLKDYESLETETTALGKKLEERNNALQKLHCHCNFDIHSLAHIKEKQKMKRQSISLQKETLNNLQDEKNSIRKYITEIKAKHIRLRYEIHQSSFQSGLLDKPILMRDYDETVQMLNKLRITNEGLKMKTDLLNKKIAQLEDMSHKKIHGNSM